MVVEVDEGGGRRRRGVVRGFLAIGGAAVALVLALTIAVAALLPQDVCSCAMPLDLVVLNYGHQDVSVTWNQAGMFGTPLRGLSGGAVAGACDRLETGLRSGLVDITLTYGGTTRSIQVHVRDGFATEPAMIMIRADGQIADPVYAYPEGGWSVPTC